MSYVWSDVGKISEDYDCCNCVADLPIQHAVLHIFYFIESHSYVLNIRYRKKTKRK